MKKRDKDEMTAVPELENPIPKDKKLPKCRRRPGLFDSQDRPQVLDIVWTKDEFADDEDEASAIVVARHDALSGDTVDLALVLFRYPDYQIRPGERIAIRRTTKQIHMEGVDDPTPWESLTADHREFARKIWEEWIDGDCKILKEGTDKGTKQRLIELAEEITQLRSEWEASKKRTSGLKKDLDKAQDKLTIMTLSQDEPTEWPWPED